MNLIFAVTEEQFQVYDLLKKNVEGSSAGTLSSDSSNVVELVTEQYHVSWATFRRLGTFLAPFRQQLY